MNTLSRFAVAVGAAGATLMFAAGPAAAHHCYNPDKQPNAGAQIVIGPNDEPTYVSKGLQNRIERGIVDPSNGDGYHGIVGFDEDGDGVAEFSTWQVTPGGTVPAAEKETGDPCHGMTDFGTYFSQCVG